MTIETACVVHKPDISEARVQELFKEYIAPVFQYFLLAIAREGEISDRDLNRFLETVHFPLSDGWSIAMRNATIKMGKEWLKGKKLVEFGSGDGRNVLLAHEITSDEGGLSGERITIVDVKEQYLDTACHNIGQAGIDEKVNAILGDAATVIQQLLNPEDFDRFFMCLPQVPYGNDEAHKAVDTYRPTDASLPFVETWDKYGLTLNAAVLSLLAEKAMPGTEGLVVLSGRIPESVRERLFDQYGWEAEVVVTQRVKQDDDTPLDFMEPLLGEEEFTKLGEGESLFFDDFGAPMKTCNAIKRVTAFQAVDHSVEPNASHEVYHDVYVYKLSKK